MLALEAGLNAVSGWLIFALMLLLVAVVLGRALFDQPIRGQVDFVQMMVPSLAFLGLSYCYRRAGHVRMDIVLRTLPGRLRIAAEFAGAVVAFAAAIILTIGTLRDTVRAYRFGDSTMDVQLLTWPARALIALGLAVFTFRMMLVLWGWSRSLVHSGASAIAVPQAPASARPEDWVEPEPPAGAGPGV